MYHGGGWMPEQVAQKGRGITTFGDTKKFTGKSPSNLIYLSLLCAGN